MNWKNTLRKQEIDMDIGSTNYAKDLGDSVKFGEGGNAITVPKSKLVELVSRYDPSIKRMTEITMSYGPNDDFVRWLNENMDSPISKAPLFGMGGSKMPSKGMRDDIIEAAMKHLDALVEEMKKGGQKKIRLSGFSVTNYFNTVSARPDSHIAVLKEKYGAKSVEIDARNGIIILNF
tara:strand:+ start:654 stop:1184 length:531 start_codon:yes stop_codon:yes gene_type:complete